MFRQFYRLSVYSDPGEVYGLALNTDSSHKSIQKEENDVMLSNCKLREVNIDSFYIKSLRSNHQD